MKVFSFKKYERLLKGSEFLDVSLNGKKGHTKNFVVIFKTNGKDSSRIGITIRKRVGNSVKRNRIKRLIREFFRLNKHKIPKGYDIVVIASKQDDNYNFAGIKKELGGLLIENAEFFFST